MTEQSFSILDAGHRIALDLDCLHCGRNLRGTIAGGFCPGCGWPVTESVQSFRLQVDGEGRVALDLPCVQCGYNLRGLPPDGRCPECARPVLASARGDFLGQASPAWVRKLARGALWLVIALSGWIGTAFFIYAVVFSTTVFSPGTPPLAALVAQLVLNLLFLIVAVVGMVELTAREPAAAAEGWSARRLTRVCLGALPLLVTGVILLQLAGGLMSFTMPFIILIVVAGIAAWMTLGIVLPLTLLRHLMNLLRRAPRRGLVTYAKIEFWGWLACSSTVIVGYVLIVTMMVLPMRRALAATPPGGAVSAPTVIATTSPGTGAGDPVLTQTYTYVVTMPGPNGSITVTGTNPATLPASRPVGPVLPALGAGFFVGSTLASIGGCAGLITAVAGYIFLILTQRAFAHCARQAESGATNHS